MTSMLLVEQHIINKGDKRWSKLDVAGLLSKNLYNAANYVVRQEYIFNHRYIPYGKLAKVMKTNPDYCALPRKVSQWVLKQISYDWKAYFAAMEEYQLHPENFQGRPRLPKYKHKTDGRNLLTYTTQAISRRVFKQQGVIQPSGLDIQIKTQQRSFDQVRIVPRKTHYVIEVVYTVQIQKAEVDPEHIAAIDIGLDNLATVTSNQPGFIPLLVNGRPLKAINQFYNKQRAYLQSQLQAEYKTSRRLDAITEKRNRRVNAYIHLVSRRIVDVLILQNIGTLIIGKNDGWKQDINLGKRINQNFVQIPHARFIDMLIYKTKLAGIKVILTEESYTSKCSFLDHELIGKQQLYAGKRIHRGLFQSRDGRMINADVNGSYNILRKVIPNAFSNGIGALVVAPVRVTPR